MAARKKVLAAMSGGVDSSVAALVLVEAGHEVAGATMSLDVPARRRDADAASDAKQVCNRLGIAHFVFDFAALMQERVIGKFTAEYLQGRTPNPCVDCNRHLKFGKLLQKARAMGFDYLATGHYARLENEKGTWHLLRPQDTIKDQTYFLYPIRKEDLSSILFPLGELPKNEVRTLAKKAGLPVAQKAESQDICFVTQENYGQYFQEKNISAPAGEIVDKAGKVLGKHRGVIYYTIGQRGGLGISAKTPLYVVEINAEKNKVIVGEKKDLFSIGLIAGDVNLLTDDLPVEIEAKIRYRKKPARCSVIREGEKLRVIFKEPQESITPGQSVVLYRDDELLGGGEIEAVIRDGKR